MYIEFSGDGGRSWTPALAPTKFVKLASTAVGSIATVWTPASGKRILLLGGLVTASAAISVLFEDNAAAADNFVFQLPTLVAGTPTPFSLGPFGFTLSAVDRVLKATGSGAGNLIGTLWGQELPA